MPNADIVPQIQSSRVAFGSSRVPRLAELQLGSSSPRVSPDVVTGFLRFAEFTLLAVLGLLVAFAYVPHNDVASSYSYLIAAMGGSIIAIGLMEILGLYRAKALTQVVVRIPTAISAWTIALGLLVAAVFFFKAGDDISRVWIMSWYAAGIVGLVASRALLGVAVDRWAKQGRLNKRALVYGSGEDCAQLLRTLESDPQTDIRICGVFDERDDIRSQESTVGYPKLGDLDELVDIVRNTRVDLVIIAMPLAAEKRVLALLEKLSVLPVDIRLAGSASQLRLNPRAYSYIGNVAMIDLIDKPISEWGNVAKSAFDRLIGLLALMLLSPVMLGVAAAIRLDSKGPVLFRQKRYGFNNELIEVFKFRSMYTDMSDAKADKLVTKDDPRVTSIGRIIRKTSIDELPQLFNVLLGDLSLVGPRPHALHAKAADKLYDAAVSNYFARHKVKPGITGWAQINGWRGETDTEDKIRKRVEHDLYYIENWSLLFDLYILAKTPFALLQAENAY